MKQYVVIKLFKYMKRNYFNASILLIIIYCLISIINFKEVSAATTTAFPQPSTCTYVGGQYQCGGACPYGEECEFIAGPYPSCACRRWLPYTCSKFTTQCVPDATMCGKNEICGEDCFCRGKISRKCFGEDYRTAQCLYAVGGDGISNCSVDLDCRTIAMQTAPLPPLKTILNVDTNMFLASVLGSLLALWRIISIL